MPVTDDELTGLRARMFHFIDEGRSPLAQLSADELETLQALHNDYPQRADQLLLQLRDHAITTANWSRHAAQRISFTIYVAAARLYRVQRAAMLRAAGNIVELNIMRPNANAPLESLDPNVMVTMKSARMRAVGLLRLRAAGRIWADMFANKFKTDWNGTDDFSTIDETIINDEFYLNVALFMAQKDPDKLANISVKPLVIECCHTAASYDKRNAPRDWLNELVWDGVERLGILFSRGYGAEPTEFNIAAGRCWFVGMVARVMSPGCQLDTMPVLIGRQGIYKSQSLRVIGGPWYKAAQSSIHAKDFLQELWGVMLLEIPELHSLVTSNASAAKAKSVITIQVDAFRKSYGYSPDEYKRTVVMVGTTNNRDWHHDESGEARRFWPIHCGTIDLEWIKENRDQLFAEALHYYSLPPLPDGSRDPRSSWWNVPREAQRELMDAESGEDVWQARIERRLSDSTLYRGGLNETPTPWDGTVRDETDWGNMVTTTRIAHQWLGLNSEQAGKRFTSNKIGVFMRQAGWKRVRMRMPGVAGLPWGWLPLVPVVDAGEAGDAATDAPIVPDDDIPF